MGHSPLLNLTARRYLRRLKHYRATFLSTARWYREIAFILVLRGDTAIRRGKDQCGKVIKPSSRSHFSDLGVAR
jgi:hypothetical protein